MKKTQQENVTRGSRGGRQGGRVVREVCSEEVDLSWGLREEKEAVSGGRQFHVEGRGSVKA